MFVSIIRSAGAVLLVGSALLLGTPDARAQMSAEDAFQEASDQCANASKGQRSFCMINAYNQYKLQSAAEMKQDTVIHVDANKTNDTPSDLNAKESFNAAAARCATATAIRVSVSSGRCGPCCSVDPTRTMRVGAVAGSCPDVHSPSSPWTVTGRS